jgi:predicted secreted protein
MINRYIPARMWMFLGGVSVCVLGLWQYVAAQQPADPAAGKPPFANAIDQRAEMIRELQAMRKLMQEQNALLKKLVDHADAGAKKK